MSGFSFKDLGRLAPVFLVAVMLLSGCSSGSSTQPLVVTVQDGGGGSGTAGNGTTFVQVERLGRPAINEGLFIVNDNLNTLNAVTPNLEPIVLSDGSSPITQDAVATLVGLGNDATRIGFIVQAFTPDVMRIDTTIASGYANGAVAVGGGVVMPIAGRLLEDDVIDITFSVLTNGAVTTDNVPYNRPTAGAGSTNPAIGHQLLNGQSAPGGTATFPFLAPPN